MNRIAVIALLVCAGLAWWLLQRAEQQSHASQIMETCKAQDDSALCYEKEVPALFPELTVPEVFTVIREIRAHDPKYQFCHVAAHKLGEEAVAEDPSKWIDLIPLNPGDGLCSNGFIHGVIVGRFRNDTLDPQTLEATIPDFARACEPRPDWRPSGLDQAICYHGMGHLLMFITNADITKSLEVCARISGGTSGGFMRVCREGVFMQIYQPLEPDDYALIELLPEKPTQDNYRRLCAAYGDADEGACLREAWPLFRDEIMKGSGAADFCAKQPNREETDHCYESVTTIIGRRSLGNEDRAVEACMSVADAYRAMCFISTAQASLEESRSDGSAAIALCKRAPEPTAFECLSALASRAVWIFPAGSPDRDRFCAALPEEYRFSCRR